jgi:hypothetical protein
MEKRKVGMQWIGIHEKIPGYMEIVLVYGSFKSFPTEEDMMVYAGMWSGGEWYSLQVDATRPVLGYVESWMPLPEGPQS